MDSSRNVVLSMLSENVCSLLPGGSPLITLSHHGT